jgi:hypothetical protein
MPEKTEYRLFFEKFFQDGRSDKPAGISVSFFPAEWH